LRTLPDTTMSVVPVLRVAVQKEAHHLKDCDRVRDVSEREGSSDHIVVLVGVPDVCHVPGSEVLSAHTSAVPLDAGLTVHLRRFDFDIRMRACEMSRRIAQRRKRDVLLEEPGRDKLANGSIAHCLSSCLGQYFPVPDMDQ